MESLNFRKISKYWLNFYSLEFVSCKNYATSHFDSKTAKDYFILSRLNAKLNATIEVNVKS